MKLKIRHLISIVEYGETFVMLTMCWCWLKISATISRDDDDELKWEIGRAAGTGREVGYGHGTQRDPDSTSRTDQIRRVLSDRGDYDNVAILWFASSTISSLLPLSRSAVSHNSKENPTRVFYAEMTVTTKTSCLFLIELLIQQSSWISEEAGEAEGVYCSHKSNWESWLWLRLAALVVWLYWPDDDKCVCVWWQLR